MRRRWWRQCWTRDRRSFSSSCEAQDERPTVVTARRGTRCRGCTTAWWKTAARRAARPSGAAPFFFLFLLPLLFFLFFPSNGVARSALAASAATLARGGVAVQRTAFSDGGGRHQHGHASLGWRLRHGLPGSDRVQWQRSAAPEMAWRAARRRPGQPAGCSSFFSFL